MHHARPALPVALLAATVLAITVGAPVANAAITARGSVGEAYVTGAAKGAAVTLLDKGGKAVDSGAADSFGSKIFRDVAPGPGYRFKVAGKQTPAFAVIK